MGGFGGGVGQAFEFMDPLFHFLTRLECHHKLFGDKDFLTGTGVTCLASSPPLDLKHAEVSQFDSLLFNERFDDRVEGLLDDFLRLQLRETDFLGNGLYNLFFGHDEVPCSVSRCSGQW